MGNYILDSPAIVPYNPGMNANGPETLLEAVKHYADLDVCHAFMAKIKWPDGMVCCHNCGSVNIGFIATRRMFKLAMEWEALPKVEMLRGENHRK